MTGSMEWSVHRGIAEFHRRAVVDPPIRLLMYPSRLLARP